MAFIARNSAPQSANLTANSLSAGSGTTNVVANSSLVVINAPTSNITVNAIAIDIGNATSNAVITYNSLGIGNSTVNAVVNGTHISLGTTWVVNTSGEVVGNGVNYSYGKFGNSTVNVVVNSSIISLGNTKANSTTINTTSLGVKSNTFNLGTSSITSNGGFTFLPNGLIMQWGKIAANSSTGNYTFPTPFPTAIFQVTVATDVAGTYGYYTLANTTTLWLRSSLANSTQCNVSYIALGN
jgi:hypothetical protein